MTTLTKLVVHLVPESVQALDSAAAITGDTGTDTVNRAIQLYAAVLRAAEHGADIVFEDHEPIRITVAPKGSAEERRTVRRLFVGGRWHGQVHGMEADRPEWLVPLVVDEFDLLDTETYVRQTIANPMAGLRVMMINTARPFGSRVEQAEAMGAFFDAVATALNVDVIRYGGEAPNGA